MENTEKINSILDNVIGGLMQLKDALNETTPEETALQIATVSEPDDNFDSFESLKKALFSPRWPQAVNANQICDPENEEELKQRGRGMIQFAIPDELRGKKFLDIGCRHGYTVLTARQLEASFSIGYDIKSNETWEKIREENPNVQLTTDFEQVTNNGPYDIIMMFDVLDHVQNEDPVSLLKKAASVLAPNGKIYVRCHPFISRHGTHLYHELNKAYVHLVFTPDEIRQLVPNSKYEEKTTGVIYSIKSYQTMVESSGLKIVHKYECKTKVEPFFKIPKIAQRIMKNTKTNTFPEFQMGFDFYDMTLQKE